MPRYKDRPLRWPDVLGRFEAGSYTRHLHNARGLIERIRDDGSQIFDKEPKLLHKWQDYCSQDPRWIYFGHKKTSLIC